MKPTVLLIATLSALLTAACDKQEKAPAQQPEAAAAPETAPETAQPKPPPPPPFTGTLDVGRIRSAAGLVRPYDLWSDAEPRLKAQLGEPGLVEGKTWIWAVMQGDSCTLMRVERDDTQNPPAVGISHHPQTLDPGDAAYGLCTRAAQSR